MSVAQVRETQVFVCARATLDRRIALGEKLPEMPEFVSNAQVEAELRVAKKRLSHGLSLQYIVALA